MPALKRSPRVRFQLKIPRGIARKFRAFARLHKRELSEVASNAISVYLSRYEESDTSHNETKQELTT